MADTSMVDWRTSLMMSIGALITALLDGGLLILGFICVSLLSSNGGRLSRQRKGLRGYAMVLLLFNIGYLVEYFIWSHFPLVFYTLNPAVDARRVAYVVGYLSNLMPLLIVCLTDGLLVWRCYVVQRNIDLGRRSGWQNVFWIIPLGLWVTTAATGFVAGILFVVGPDPATTHPQTFILEGTALVSNCFVSIFTTCYITTCLLLHKRMVKAAFGKNAPTDEHLRIIGILLESAAINVPITIVAAVGLATDWIVGTVTTPIAVTCQSLASVLIIYRVALGRAVGQQTEEDGGRIGELSTVFTNFETASTV